MHRLLTSKTALVAAVSAALLAGCSRAAETKRCPGSTSPDFVAFIGSRISVTEVHQKEADVPFDSVYRARYRVVEVLCGRTQGPEIEFLAYDHYGRPAFADFDTALLYVSKVEGALLHEKYQFQPVFETETGEWAGCGDPYEWEPAVHKGKIIAKPKTFKKAPVFDVGSKSFASREGSYPSQYFEVSGAKARCVAGASAEELFAVKRDGVLRARGLFE